MQSIAEFVKEVSSMENLQNEGVFHRIYDLPAEVRAVIYEDLLGNFHIVINQNISAEEQRLVFLHEYVHYKQLKDMEGSLLIIDKNNDPIEEEADFLAGLLYKKLIG